MGCNCGRPESNGKLNFTPAVVQIDNPERLVLFRKVVIPASMGDEKMVPPVIGKYYNVLLEYEANGNLYIYSSDGIPTMLSTDVDEVRRALEQEIEDRRTADEAITVMVEELQNNKADKSELSAVAFSGEYNDLLNEPLSFSSSDWGNLWT